MTPATPMALTSVMYAARPDGKWAVLDRGPPMRALVADRSVVLAALTHLSKTHAEVLPESLGAGLGMGVADMSRTTADDLFTKLRSLGAEEPR